MRIALLSPFPPSKSGIADYSEALAGALAPLASLVNVPNAASLSQLQADDLPVYQIGNNDAHDFVYDTALRRPGVVVLHEANLHHLIAEITIKRGNWDAYMDAVSFDGGPKALEFAHAVRRLEVGPDYDGVPMLRRILSRTRGLIVHSEYVATICRQNGYQGPLAVIPHGAWLPEVDGAAWREKLGLGPDVPLLGTFGHLKPYKRIREMLRAFRRVVRRNPFAKLIMVGEEHPDLPLTPLLESLDLQANVRVIGHASIEDFVGYMAACDVIVNLRYPTVGESSGSMLRALGLGKPVLVSSVGSFAEFPDSVCLKVPVGGHAEEELIYEYLRYLTEDPDAARAMGEAARDWVRDNCNWDHVARQYLRFCEQVAAGEGAVEPNWLAPEFDSSISISQQTAAGPMHVSPGELVAPSSDSSDAIESRPESLPLAPLPLTATEPGSVTPTVTPATTPTPEPEVQSDTAEPTPGPTKETDSVPAIVSSAPTPTVPTPLAPVQVANDAGHIKVLSQPALPQLDSPIAQELLRWAPNDEARQYLMTHLSRLADTIELLPEGNASQSVLEMGCYMQLTPLLKEWRHYGEIRGCYYGTLGLSHDKVAHAQDGREFSCVVDEFDAERDPYPYPDERFDAVICTELFEHLASDPMYCLWEANRILKTGGYFLLSTPNVCSLRAIAAILDGYHPGFFPAFMKPNPDGPTDPRHHREYASREIRQGLEDAGFEVAILRTGAYWHAPEPERAWVEHLLDHYGLDQSMRGECIFALGRKVSAPKERFPAWLYCP